MLHSIILAIISWGGRGEKEEAFDKQNALTNNQTRSSKALIRRPFAKQISLAAFAAIHGGKE